MNSITINGVRIEVRLLRARPGSSVRVELTVRDKRRFATVTTLCAVVH